VDWFANNLTVFLTQSIWVGTVFRKGNICVLGQFVEREIFVG
jgi:hypothetical protein